MAVFRVEKTKDFTVMSNHHLRNTELSLKAKGLLSLMLSLPEDWDYTTKGLAHICRDGVDSITTALKELERHGYLTRQRLRNENGQLRDIEYTIHEKPVTGVKQGVPPKRENPRQAKPEQAEPGQENPAQLNTNPQRTKKSVEDFVRAHLRGFARTIPSFIMAYGDGKLTLQNFDEYTEDDVFEEVTGITEEDFRFLRDGGEYKDPETGAIEHFAGNLFDETVFNDSIEEFWKKKQELADYFDATNTEDIFDYIPPQKTNQIFTPRWVVEKMVDELEQNNPGCFDDPTKTFADLYMKSGLYITEIVKRLFRSEKMKEVYPDDKERVQHILKNQAYGMAPTRIIYLIATNYILGFDEQLQSEMKNFVQADAAQAAKENRLDKLVEECFG